MQPNWEQLFDKRSYCPWCGEDITINSCDCSKDVPVYDEMNDEYE